MRPFLIAALLCHAALTAAPQGAQVNTETKFETKVVELPAKKLAGLSATTSMEKVGADSQALWQAFAPRINEIAVDAKELFGATVMRGEGALECWAAVETALPLEGPLPARMKKLDAPAGAYVQCTVPGIEHIGAAYGHIYSEWAKANPGLEPDHSRPSIERYPNPWTPGMALDIFVPIKKKAGE